MAAKETASSIFCSPSLVLLISTRSSAYAKIETDCPCNLKAMSLFSLHFEITALISNSDVRLNNIGLIGQPCLTPALTLIGSVSSAWDVLTTVVASG